MKPRPEMTVKDIATEMRAAGFKVTEGAIVDLIEQGAYPFGRIVHKGRSGKRTIHVLRVDFLQWLERVTNYPEV